MSESRRSKAREVSSRFLSPTSSIESANSPPQIKTKSSSTNRSGLWPSSNKKQGTLKDLINDEDDSSDNGPKLSRQSSCSEKQKENHRPIGGSMRYTGKLRFPGGKSSSMSSSTSTTTKSSSFTNFVKGRLSVDENNLNRRRTIDPFTETISSESESSDYTYSGKNYTYLSSTASSRRLAGIEVSSRYLHDASLTKSSSRRGESYSFSISASTTPDNSNLPPKNAMKRASSLTTYKSISPWALSPGRSSSPSLSVENKGKPVPSFSNLRPPHSPVKNKGVGNLLSMGLDLFKSKKSSSDCSSPVGQGVGESSHQLRMFHNRLVQWRFVNARADIVNATKLTQAQSTLSNARVSLSDLQSSVVQKRIRLQKEKLEFKLNNVLDSQIEPLQNWGDIERQHLSALSVTKDCVHSVVCRVPLVEGAKVDSHSTSVALRHATDLTASIKTMLTDFLPTAQKEGELLKELAEVVTIERSLLEECFDLIEMLSSLETQEKSLQCNIVQLKSQQQRCQPRQQPQNVVM